MSNIVNTIYNHWVDGILSIPLVQPRDTNNISDNISDDIERAIRINNQIVSSVSSIRRHLSYEEEEADVPNILDVIDNLFSSALEATLFYIPEEFEDVQVTVTDKDFKKFKKTKLTSEDVDKCTDVCNICIEPYKVNEKTVTLPCHHFFHDKCIRYWLCNEKVSCPVCRHDVREQT